MSGTDSEQPPILGEVLDMELDADTDRRYLVLFDEHEYILIDAEDSVVLLLDCISGL